MVDKTWMGGVLTFLEVAHMVDATALIGWGGVGMLTFLEVSHMVDLLFLGFKYACTLLRI